MMNTKGVYRRGKIWWVRYSGPTGQTIWESSHSHRKQDAVALYHKRKAGFKVDLHPATGPMGKTLFKDLATDYLEWAKRQKSYASKRYTVKQLVELFGLLPLNSFTSKMLEEHQTNMLADGKKPSTVNRTLAAIHHMFTKAAEWDMVDEEVLKRLRKVKALPERNQRLRYLSPQECDTLIGKCDDRLRPIVIMALHTGMRRGEILGLTWDNIDLKRGLILLKQDQTKNSKGREIGIDDTLRATLNALLPRHPDIPYVFINPSTGKKFGDLKHSFATVLLKTGIRDFRFHDLRHTFASLMVMAGVDILTVSRLLGHSTLKMTMRYAHLSPAHMKDACNKLEQALAAPDEERIAKCTGQLLDNL